MDSSSIEGVSVAVLCGGVGAARFLRGLQEVVPAQNITAIVNTGDDVVMHGLHISPDLDTCMYTLADAINPETGWGLRNETWRAMESLRRYEGAEAWFNLGDADIGTHMFRTQRLAAGDSLSTVTAAIARAWDLSIRFIPVTNDRIETRVTLVDEGEVGFQEYFVRRQHDVAVTGVRIVGSDAAVPAPGVLEAIRSADAVVIAPSNPIVSIGPLLAVPGVRAALADRRNCTVAISPIIAGAALKGPADRMLIELGHEATVTGVARLYADLARVLIVDTADTASLSSIEDVGMDGVACPTVMTETGVAAALARTAIDSALQPGGDRT